MSLLLLRELACTRSVEISLSCGLCNPSHVYPLRYFAFSSTVIGRDRVTSLPSDFCDRAKISPLATLHCVIAIDGYAPSYAVPYRSWSVIGELWRRRSFDNDEARNADDSTAIPAMAEPPTRAPSCHVSRRESFALSELLAHV